MKSVTNKELISVILVNIGLLAAAVYMWLIYDHRQTIIKSEEPIQNYSVLEVNCRRRTSSSIVIEFNGKRYYVGISRDKCVQFDPQKIKFFYDEGGNLAASKIRNLECPSYEICLIDYGCGKFNRKIHIMEQYP